MKRIDVSNKVKYREYSREVSDKSQCSSRKYNYCRTTLKQKEYYRTTKPIYP